MRLNASFAREVSILNGAMCFVSRIPRIAIGKRILESHKMSRARAGEMAPAYDWLNPLLVGHGPELLYSSRGSPYAYSELPANVSPNLIDEKRQPNHASGFNVPATQSGDL
jgi:hypothetical protein